jgi:hypothetical protein
MGKSREVAVAVPPDEDHRSGPGSALPVSWPSEIVKAGHVRLCQSRMLFVYPRETQEMVFDAHDPRSLCSRAPADPSVFGLPETTSG